MFGFLNYIHSWRLGGLKSSNRRNYTARECRDETRSLEECTLKIKILPWGGRFEDAMS